MWWLSEADEEEFYFTLGLVMGVSYGVMQAACPWLPDVPDL